MNSSVLFACRTKLRSVLRCTTSALVLLYRKARKLYGISVLIRCASIVAIAFRLLLCRADK